MGIDAALRAGSRLVLEDLPASGLAYVLAVERLSAPLLIVTTSEERCEQLHADLRALGLSDTVVFPGDEHVPFEEASPDAGVAFQRFALRYRLEQGQRPAAVVTTPAALQSYWMPDDAFFNSFLSLRRGASVDREALARHFVSCGYQRVNLVEDEGTFGIRGGIVDVFRAGDERPTRLDLFGDDIASIKHFDPQSQRTFGDLERFDLFAIRDVVFTEQTIAHAAARIAALGEHIDVPTRRLHAVVDEIRQGNYFFGIEALWPAFYDGRAAVLDALLARDVVVVLDDVHSIEEQLTARAERAEHERRRALERHQVVVSADEHVPAAGAVLARLGDHALLCTTPLADSRSTATFAHGLRDVSALRRELQARRDNAQAGDLLDPLVAELRRCREQRRALYLACSHRGHAEKLHELLVARRLDLPLLAHMPDLRAAGTARSVPVGIVVAPLTAGLIDEARHIEILTDAEIFGAAQRPQRRRRRAAAPKDAIATLKNLREQDLVIHTDHGLGRYLGLKRLVVDGVDADYVHLEYAGGDKLYLPVYRLNVLQRYRGPSDAVRLDKLGGTRWLNAKARVRDAVLQLAQQLIALQARRKTVAGCALPAPDDPFRAFEATFPYEETPDQQKAIDDTLRDLTQDSPMDRLVCGDVGFGKTEVALRAAFLAVLGDRQVGVLVPTTVLAEQHGITFRERLAPFGVNVEVLSRFRTPQEVRDIAARLQRGAIDVLIGTHRMLSPDVAFARLGLLVVDEEQRFGVRNKERIKQLRANIHVLTLTATPIPRTLHMAMVGLRDLSIIQTPPTERMSIRTEVTRFDEDVIREAIERELHRGGQVFVVHNRVRSIQAMAHLVQRLVPSARVAVAHGQMGAEELERIMVDFVRREHNVLVCTAIIESGIDIPSANTMIVNRADAFGLSQLYQLRGRIGRGRERAHAYLLLPRSDRITKLATERLATLKRFSELGSGFQVASQDLDLRGAGDLLGASQSGHIEAVGFELYTELLAEAVERAKGMPVREHVEPELKLPVPAVIPESYVPGPVHRLEFYERMAGAASDQRIYDIAAEIAERFGPAPAEVDNLAETMVLRRRLLQLRASHLSAAVGEGTLRAGVAFLPDSPVDRQDLIRRCQAEPGTYRLLPSGKLSVTLPLSEQMSGTDVLRLLRQALATLRVDVGEVSEAPP